MKHVISLLMTGNDLENHNDLQNAVSQTANQLTNQQVPRECYRPTGGSGHLLIYPNAYCYHIATNYTFLLVPQTVRTTQPQLLLIVPVRCE